MHDHQQFFLEPSDPVHRRYEALRAFYVDHLSAKDAAERFGWSLNYFNKIRSQFHQALQANQPPQLFLHNSPGPQPTEIDPIIQEKIVALRKENHSIQDIKTVLNAQDIHLSLRHIDNVLKDHRFPRLPKRSRRQQSQTQLPTKIEPPKTVQLHLTTQAPRQMTTRYGGVFFFVPFMNQLELPQLIEQAGYPQTSQLSALNYILSLLFLKLIDKKRLSHINDLCLDGGAGLFTGLNSLPKSPTISSYSYKTARQMNRLFLKGLHQSVQQLSPYSGDINLDFTAIPHWGDASALEKNWDGSRNKVLKSVLALLALDPDTGFIPYGDANITHDNKNDAVLEFIDFWKETSSRPLKCLIFDSKFTTYQNLSRINQEGIKFITLRRKGKNLIHNAESLPNNKWHTVQLDATTRKYKHLKINESRIHLTQYAGSVRQLIITGHGRDDPAFIITNDFNATQKQIVTKYARRWLVEKGISEQIYFFHLNMLSSSIVVKVDLDLTMSIAAHTLYRLLANTLAGFEHAEAKTIYRYFIETIADISINYPTIDVKLLKKVHSPILFENVLFKKSHTISWLNDAQLKFSVKNST